MKQLSALVAIAEDGAVVGARFEAQTRIAPGHDETMIHVLVDERLDQRLDPAEVQHHTLLVQPALELDVDDPAVAQETPLRMEQRAVDDAQMFDEQTAHGTSGP